MRVEESVEINRPLQEVFDYVANPREPAGVIEHSPRGARRNAGALVEEGARFTTVAKFLGRRFETPFEVSVHDPPRRHTDRST